MAHNSTGSYSNTSLDFSDTEIRSELSRLGYNNINDSQFQEFKRDLLTLVQVDRSNSSNSSSDSCIRLCHHHSPTSATHNKYDRLYEPPVLVEPPFRGKENANINFRLHSSSQERRPLGSTQSNTLSRYHVIADDSVKASGDYRLDGAKSLPVRTSVCASNEEQLERPHSAELTRHLTMDKLYDGVSLGKGDGHLDDYWYRDDSSFTHQRNSLHSARRQDCVSAAPPDYPDKGLPETFNERLNLSQASQSSLVKRKVSRKMSDGTSQVYEESYIKTDSDTETESEAEGEVGGEGRMMRDQLGHIITEPVARQQSAVRLPSTRYNKSVDPVRSAVIWPEVKPVASRNVVRSDPVNRYLRYQQEWDKTKVPEEKKHKNLRWSVREQMLYKDVIYEKPPKKFVTNKYVVPTDKKRKDLRWRIRADMAAGLLPNGH